MKNVIVTISKQNLMILRVQYTASSTNDVQNGHTPLAMAVTGGEFHGPSDPNMAASKGRWRWTGAAGALHGEASLLPRR